MEVSVENITKSYGFQKAVDSISFNVKAGEIVGFLGPNGAGKTTTMKIITCFMTPNEGDVKVGGVSILTQVEEVKKHIGYLPETNPLYKEMPMIDYLKFVAELQGVPKGKIRDRIFEMVQICGLKNEKYKKIGELSNQPVDSAKTETYLNSIRDTVNSEFADEGTQPIVFPYTLKIEGNDMAAIEVQGVINPAPNKYFVKSTFNPSAIFGSSNPNLFNQVFPGKDKFFETKKKVTKSRLSSIG
jgi:ABC-type dipeptide/oligopeptide/nickel transport system ATPase component